MSKNLPSAEELARAVTKKYFGPRRADEEPLWMMIMKAINVDRNAVLEAAEKLVEERISVDSGDPARWTDSVIVPLLAEIRKLKEEL